MRLQQTGPISLTIAALIGLAGGCAAPSPGTAPYAMVATGSLESGVRVYQSEHYSLFTTLTDLDRVGPIMQTLEAGHTAYVTATGIHPRDGSARMNVYVFQRRNEWEAFTRQHTGAAAAIYLRLLRGGYTFGDACAVVDQGERDTLSILAHEGFHLFLTNRFVGRPPPFIEEGLATTFESVVGPDGTARPELAGRASTRANRMPTDLSQRSLRELLGMHAGNVIGHSAVEVDAFYGHAAMFVGFLRTGEGGRYRASFERLLNDAAAGRLSSEDLNGTAALVERYLGRSLESIETAYRAYLAEKAEDSTGGN